MIGIYFLKLFADDLGRFMGETRGTGGRIFDVACIYDKNVVPSYFDVGYLNDLV